MADSNIMNIAGTWCNKFSEEQLFSLFNIGKVIKEDWKLSGDQEGLVLTKDSVKLIFDIKIMTKNCVIFCAYL